MATLENAVRQARSDASVTGDQLGVFREALNDLSQRRLVSTHVDVIRSRFARAGFKPLAFVEGGGNGDDND